MKREDKIKNIKALLTRQKKVDDLVEGKEYIVYKRIGQPYYLGNQAEPGAKQDLTEEEYQAWLETRHPKDKVVVFKEQEGNAPLDEPIEEQ